MKTLIIYDSLYGNTEKIARAVQDGLISREKPEIVPVREATFEKMRGVQLLVVGSPTQGGRPTKAVQQFLDEMLNTTVLKDMRVAVFDTGIRPEDLNFALKILVRMIGYAAPKMAASLKKKGGVLKAPPVGFYVKGKSGPLLAGEIERAQTWAKSLA